MKRRLAVLLLLVSASCNSHAEWDTSLRLSPGLIHFDYTEFSSLGLTLNNESGWLPGIGLSVATVHDSGWKFEASIVRYQGTVDYDGLTQQGDSHSTQTDTRFTRAGLQISKDLLPKLDMVAGFTSHEWIRDIRNNNSVYGLLEKYRWHEYALGLRLSLLDTPADDFDIEGSYLITRDNTIDIDLSRLDLGSAVLDIKDGDGGRIRGTWLRHIEEDFRAGLALTYEAWDFGRSNTKVTSGGSSSVFVTEPRSETRNISLTFMLQVGI